MDNTWVNINPNRKAYSKNSARAASPCSQLSANINNLLIQHTNVQFSPVINKPNTKKPAAVCHHACMSACLSLSPSVHLVCCQSESKYTFFCNHHMYGLDPDQFSMILSDQSFHYCCPFHWVPHRLQ